MSPAKIFRQDRPRTRAQVKPEALEPALERSRQVPEPVLIRRGTSQRRRPTKRKDASDKLAADARATRSKSVVKSTKGPTQRSKARSQLPARRNPPRIVGNPFRRDLAPVIPESTSNPGSVTTWLAKVRQHSQESVAEEHSITPAPEGAILAHTGAMMDSSSTSKEQQSGGGSTVKVPGARKVSLYKVTDRHIQQWGSDDDRKSYFEELLISQLPNIPIKDVPQLQKAAKDFAAQMRKEQSRDCFPVLENHQFELDRIKSELRYPVEHIKYYEAKLQKCLENNEAVLQRTLLMSTFHQYWLGDEKFDWNAEGQWQLGADSRLFSESNDSISMPKPDLAFSYNTKKAFTLDEDGSDARPEHLRDSFSPEGSDRCFPFLFIEVKRQSNTLKDANLTNLHTASQALCNIHQWMAAADHTDIFHQKVRVFTMSFNAQDLGVRIHRAGKRKDGKLSFRYQDFIPSQRYSRDEICLLISAILRDYAAKELYDILLAAYKQVIERTAAERLAKRKGASLEAGNAKQARKSGTANATTASFAMESTNLGE